MYIAGIDNITEIWSIINRRMDIARTNPVQLMRQIPTTLHVSYSITSSMPGTSGGRGMATADNGLGATGSRQQKIFTKITIQNKRLIQKQ